MDFIGRFSLPVVMNHIVLENLMHFGSEINWLYKDFFKENDNAIYQSFNVTLY